ncbi:hypothetical protein BdWA1_002921 [Babesia duncani]|uniref:Uncharacterized protein n=1 Tax=Babesia duncani TaxID=323732 RepID=A0AAD9UMP4_9APIC|nr:hypothetical protein BdWA1_002921 [Babesia duncani]
MTHSNSVVFLSAAKKRIDEIVMQRGGSEHPAEIVKIASDLSQHIHDTIAFFQLCNVDNAVAAVKSYEENVQANPNAHAQTQLEHSISQLQVEAEKAVGFLDYADLLLKCTRALLFSDPRSQNKILISHRDQLNRLIKDKAALQDAIDKQRQHLEILDNEIALHEAKLKEMEMYLSSKLNELQRNKCTRGLNLTQEGSLQVISQRLENCNMLLEALNASPLTLIENSDNKIVYRYTSENNESHDITISECQRRNLKCTIEPEAPEAQEYISRHLKDCKTRIDIAAIVQEGFSI